MRIQQYLNVRLADLVAVEDLGHTGRLKQPERTGPEYGVMTAEQLVAAIEAATTPDAPEGDAQA